MRGCGFMGFGHGWVRTDVTGEGGCCFWRGMMPRSVWEEDAVGVGVGVGVLGNNGLVKGMG